jgi:hypothetical protein
MKLALMVIFLLTFVPATVADRQAGQEPRAEGSDKNRSETPRGERKDADADALDGTYLCEGKRPDGTPYHGTVAIVRHNGAYNVIWTVSSEEQYFGIGVLSGEVLAVSYFGGIPGVVAYKVERQDGNPRLVGQWTVANAGGHLFSETLTRLSREVALPTPPPRRDRELHLVHPLLRPRPA